VFFNHRIVGRVFRVVATLGFFLLAGLIVSELWISAEPGFPVDTTSDDVQGVESQALDSPEIKPSVVHRVEAVRDTL